MFDEDALFAPKNLKELMFALLWITYHIGSFELTQFDLYATRAPNRPESKQKQDC